MYAYRIADARHPVFDPTGAMLYGGRWNSPGKRVIYAAETYAGALLEILAHANGSQPPKHHQSVRITIPDDLPVETIYRDQLSGRDAEDCIASRAFGDKWFDGKRTVALRVPSVITQGREYNIVIHADHPQFKLLQVGTPEPVAWDARLFKFSKS
jgi:RES domain-containing protein